MSPVQLSAHHQLQWLVLYQRIPMVLSTAVYLGRNHRNFHQSLYRPTKLLYRQMATRLCSLVSKEDLSQVRPRQHIKVIRAAMSVRKTSVTNLRAEGSEALKKS